MSAALQLPMVWGASSSQQAWQEDRRNGKKTGGASREGKAGQSACGRAGGQPGFYRKHTESMLRRYLYASMQVGRAPSILGDPIAGDGFEPADPHLRGRGDLRSRRGKCLNQLGSLDRRC
jgi:hypothetical protein